MIQWTNNYIGIPFLPNGRDRAGLDCWGLVCLVYSEIKGIQLPQYRDVFIDTGIGSLRRVARMMSAERLSWAKVAAPEPLDVIMLRHSEFVWHVGLVIDHRRMLHVDQGINSVIEDYVGIIWRNKVDEFRRYTG